MPQVMPGRRSFSTVPLAAFRQFCLVWFVVVTGWQVACFKPWQAGAAFEPCRLRSEQTRMIKQARFWNLAVRVRVRGRQMSKQARFGNCAACVFCRQCSQGDICIA